MAGKACHVFRSTTRLGLTLALAALDIAGISFKAIAVIHALVGWFLLQLVVHTDLQEECIYPEGETALGHVRMHFVVITCYAMVFGGIAGLFWPVPALVLIWGSVAAYSLGGLTESIVTRTWPGLCGRCALALLARILPAGAMTFLYVYYIRKGGG